MDKKEKKQYLEMLVANELFLDCLKKASSDVERKKIKAFAEDIFINLIEGFSVMQKVVVENPEKVVEVAKTYIPKE